MQTVETFFCLLTFVASLATDPGVLAAPSGAEQPVFNETMPSKSTTIGFRSFNLSVGALNNSLDFMMFGCGELKLSFLRSIPANAADGGGGGVGGDGDGGADGGGGEPFVQVYIGNQKTISIRKCRDPSSSGVRETRGGGEVSCEDLVADNVNVAYCYDQSNFRLRWNESTIEVLGGFNNKPCDKTLIIYTLPLPPPTPPPSSPSSPIPSSTTEFSVVKEGEKASEDLPIIQTMLTGIHTIRVENGDHSLQFTIFRRTNKNFCFVGEKEESRVAQCGDDFISKQRCIDCGCCYDDYRQTPCYQSLVAASVDGTAPWDNCTRSIEDIFPEMNIFPRPLQPIYINESIEFLLIIGSFISPQFNFTIDFDDDDDEAPILLEQSNLTLAEPLPDWLAETKEFQRLESERNFSIAQLQELYRCSVMHVYDENKTFSVSLRVSGQMTRNESSWSTWNKSATVTVESRPTLEEVLNGTFLFFSFPVYRLAAASFLYVVRNSDPSLNFTILFPNTSLSANLSLVAMNASLIPGWVNASASSSSSSTDEDSELTPCMILEEMSDWYGGEIQHVFQSSGIHFVNFTVSGRLESVGVHSTLTRTAEVKVRPRMKDLTGPMLFISKTPAYVGISVHFLFLIRNHHHSLVYDIDYDDDDDDENNSTLVSRGRLEFNFNGTEVPDWVRSKYYKLHRVDQSQAEQVLSDLHLYNCSLVSYVFNRVRRHTTKVKVAGQLKEVGRYESVTHVSIVDVIERGKTIGERLAPFVLLTSKTNYVNESTYFLYRFGDFSDDLELSVSYCDECPDEDLSVTGSATLPHWVLSGQYVSNDDNRTAIEQLFSDQGDSFLGGVSSHEYTEIGTYNVTFHVRNATNNTTQEGDDVQRSTTTTVGRRPTLTEVIGEVVVLVKRPVYEGLDTTFLTLVENHFPALSCDLDFGDDSSPAEFLLSPSIALPIWVKSPNFSYLSAAQSNRSVVDELLGRVPGISGAVTKHMYATSGPRNVSVTVSGWLDIVARKDEHRSAVVVVNVKERSRVNDSLGLSVLLVSDPATVNETVRFLFMANRLVPDVDFQLDFGDGSPPELMTPISDNLNALEWMSEQRFISFGPVDPDLPSMMDDLSMFNGTATTQTHVYTAPGQYLVFLLLSAEHKVPLETGKFPLNVVGRPSTADYQSTDHDNKSGVDGDTLSSVDPLFSHTIASQNNEVASSDSASSASASAAEITTSSVLPLSSSSSGSMDIVADANVSSSSSKDASRSTKMLPMSSTQPPPPPSSSSSSSSTSSPGSSRCGPVEIIVAGGGLQRQSPAKFTRRDSFHLKAFVLDDCHRHLLDDVMWKVFRLSEANDDDMVEIWMPIAFVRETEVHIMRYTIDYGTYKIQAKVVQDRKGYVGDAYVAITSSPLTVKILGDDVIQTDTETAVIIRAEPGIDIDEPRELTYASTTFEWFCMNTGEKSPYSDPLHEDNADGVGCYGNGRRMNSTSREFRFDPTLLFYTDLPTSFTVQVALTKPNRPRAAAALASQFIIVVPPENPVLVRCTFNCGAYMNTWMEMILNVTCSAPVCRAANQLTYRWDFLPLCPQNSVKQLRWLKDTMTSANQSSLHLMPNVFNSSTGNEPYQFTLTITVDNSRHFDTRYQFLTRRHDPVGGEERARIKEEAAQMDESSSGQSIVIARARDFWLTVSPLILLLLFLFSR